MNISRQLCIKAAEQTNQRLQTRSDSPEAKRKLSLLNESSVKRWVLSPPSFIRLLVFHQFRQLRFINLQSCAILLHKLKMKPTKRQITLNIIDMVTRS